jgi:serine/threonine protein phosphatase 1
MILNLIRKADRVPRTPKGKRVYAIGDIHGRADLLDALLADIERDIATRPPAETFLVFLGDFIDRGPSSRETLDRLSNLNGDRYKPIFLIGNHEEVLLRLLAGERGLLASWLRYGGAECAESYGLNPKQLGRQEEGTAIDALRRAIPESHVAFLNGLIDTFRFGDFLFVHAGIRPGIDLNEQSQTDLRWIRAAFLDDRTDHGFVVIHGHTIFEAVDEQANRIGIDTGAYWSGILTAVGLEDAERWYLSTNIVPSEQTQALVD